MTQSLSFIVADRPPAMYRIEAVAIVVSRISMNVGIDHGRGDEPGVDRRAADGVHAEGRGCSCRASFGMIEGEG